MPIQRIAGLQVHQAGTGPAVLMLHGLGGTLSVWEPQAAAIAAAFTAIRYDSRGAGGSPAERPLSIAGWVDDLAALMDALGLEKAHLVGHSLGTLVAQHFAARFPERVSSLALCGINRSPPDARRASVRQRAEDVRRHGMAPLVDTLLAGATSAHSRRHAPAAMAAIREMLSRQVDRDYAWSCEAMAEGTRPDLSSLDAPLLLVCGLDDTVSPPQLSRELAAERSGTTLVEIADCGHWMPLEQPERVTRALLDFLPAGA